MKHPLAICWLLAGVSTVAATATATAQNQAASFTTGTTAQIDVPASPFLTPSTGITVEAWVTYDDATVPTGVGDQYPSVLRHTLLPGGESYLLRVDALSNSNTALNFTVRTTNGLAAVSAGFAPGSLVNWSHLAGTYDGQTLAIYLNGQLANSVPVSGDLVDGGGDLAIGNGGDGTFTTATTWNGEIDELRIWPFARTAAEINETLNTSLFGVPGALTFNLDGSGVDTSQGLVGVPTAAVTFATGQTTLPAAQLGVTPTGTASTSCPQTLGLVAGSTARAGNQDFELICYDASRGALGLASFSIGVIPSPIPVLGVDVFLDPATLFPASFTIMSDASGTARLQLPLPAAASGAMLSAQFGFLDTTCGAPLVASNALTLTVL